jgi:hypothetical protein
VVIPSAAIIVFGGQSWCYVETGDKTYERRVVPLEDPVEGGYLVRSGFAPGTKVVVRGAGVLLAREAEPESDEGDDEGGVSDSRRDREERRGTADGREGHMKDGADAREGARNGAAPERPDGSAAAKDSKNGAGSDDTPGRATDEASTREAVGSEPRSAAVSPAKPKADSD